ncbi:hypothetical protein [Priestia megaterium]|uniref:hypothetical protein n=1 Tax=Priestia megaterium TaxID=1404 RepID=UPI002B24A1C9|nr:hypothetical protein [Priestia megaterium]MEB2294458.1 hypothetical protein [Priestia megaterium]
MNRENLSKIDAAIIMAFLTAISYRVAYAYEISYQKYYHSPDMFIELNMYSITKIALFIFCFLIGACLVIYGGIYQKLGVMGMT